MARFIALVHVATSSFFFSFRIQSSISFIVCNIILFYFYFCMHTRICLCFFFVSFWVDKHIQIHKYKSRNYCESLKSICVSYFSSFSFAGLLFCFICVCKCGKHFECLYILYVCIELVNQKPFSSPFCFYFHFIFG